MGDITDKGIGRLASQYDSSTEFQGYKHGDSTKFQAYIEGFLAEYEELEISRLKLLNDRWLDTANGINLDNIGEIVGIERPTVPQALVDFFGFSDDPTSLGFGSDIQPSVGGQFFDENSGTEILADDDVYLFAIRGQIILNFTSMTAPETVELLSFLVGGAQVRYYLNGNLHPVYEIYKTITLAESIVIESLPTILGVDDIVYISTDASAFGFFDDPTALGFGFGIGDLVYSSSDIEVLSGNIYELPAGHGQTYIVGQYIEVVGFTGSSANNGSKKVIAFLGNQITVENILVAELPGDAVTITGIVISDPDPLIGGFFSKILT